MKPESLATLREYMIEEVTALRASGLPASQFSIGKPYTCHKLRYWSLKLRNEEEPLETTAIGGFSQIAVSNPISLDSSVVKAEIICPNGIRIALYEPLTASFLKSLL